MDHLNSTPNLNNYVICTILLRTVVYGLLTTDNNKLLSLLMIVNSVNCHATLPSSLKSEQSHIIVLVVVRKFLSQSVSMFLLLYCSKANL